MELRHLDADEKALWDRLVKATPESGFMQTWAWSLFKEAEGQKVLRLGVFEKDTLCAGAIIYYVPSMIGASALELPHGPVLPWQEPAKAAKAFSMILKELEKIAQEVGAPMARIEPFMRAPLPAYIGKVIRAPLDLIPTPTLLVPIGGEDETILAQMTSKGRYNIKLAQKKGVEVGWSVDETALDDFYYLFELTFHKHDFAGEPRSFFQNMLLALRPDHGIRIYQARYKGMLLASAIAVFCGKRGTYLYGGNLPFLGSAMASYAIHWQMMKDARDAGCLEYDFYGIAPEGQPFHPYAKFSQFKSRFGGRKVNPAGAHDIYFYSQLAKMWIQSAGSVQNKEVFHGSAAS
jgi:lipid II:glycine glycyltransferase (peptidoglycan interpeptide bridge formation enzyme)